jgi:hypothetical protein
MTDLSSSITPADVMFADLVVADDDWLRAEFDAIIAAAWPERNGTEPITNPSCCPLRSRLGRAVDDTGVVVRTRRRGTEARSRQRSPPNRHFLAPMRRRSNHIVDEQSEVMVSINPCH